MYLSLSFFSLFMQTVFEKFADYRFKRIVCVDHKSRCKGIISVSDLLTYFLWRTHILSIIYLYIGSLGTDIGTYCSSTEEEMDVGWSGRFSWVWYCSPLPLLCLLWFQIPNSDDDVKHDANWLWPDRVDFFSFYIISTKECCVTTTIILDTRANKSTPARASPRFFFPLLSWTICVIDIVHGSSNQHSLCTVNADCHAGVCIHRNSPVLVLCGAFGFFFYQQQQQQQQRGAWLVYFLSILLLRSISNRYISSLCLYIYTIIVCYVVVVAEDMVVCCGKRLSNPVTLIPFLTLWVF